MNTAYEKIVQRYFDEVRNHWNSAVLDKSTDRDDIHLSPALSNPLPGPVNLRPGVAVIAVLLIFFCAALPVAQATPGDIDPTFGGFGKDGVMVETGVEPIDMVVQLDGRIVTMARKWTSLVVFRYLPNGTPDETFGSGGKVEIPSPPGIVIQPQAVSVHSDGKIVVAGGTTEDMNDVDSNFLLVRLTASGQLDTTFGNKGFVTTNFFNNNDIANAVLIQPYGNIVACGNVRPSDDNSDFGVARYKPDGSLDASFSGDGKANIGFGDFEFCTNLVMQGNKYVLVGGKALDDPIFGDFGSESAIARLNSDGALDKSFDGDGKRSLDLSLFSRARDVAIQSDDKIVMCSGDFDDVGYLVRFLTDGKLDETFGNGGKVFIPYNNLNALILEPNGKLLTLGYHISPDGDIKFGLHRRLADGSPDSTFNNNANGLAYPDFGGEDEGLALGSLPDGRILAFGRSNENMQVLIRLWPDGTYDTSGQQIHSPGHLGFGLHEGANSLALHPDGGFLTAGEAYNRNYTNSVALVTRFKSNGLPDTAFGAFDSAYVNAGQFSSFTAVVTQPDGKIVAAGYSLTGSQGGDFLVARFNPNGLKDTSFGTSGIYTGDFNMGTDSANAVALTPDGKIVVAGFFGYGTRSVPGIIRLTGTGQPDNTFNGNGKVHVLLDQPSQAAAVIVQPDGKIVIGCNYNNDFFLERFLPDGRPDLSFGGNNTAYVITDLGGDDSLTALAGDKNGYLYAAGSRAKNGDFDIAVVQYTPNGVQATCDTPGNCQNWPTGTFMLDISDFDYANAIDLRFDNQLVVAGCIDNHFAAVQVDTKNVDEVRYFGTDIFGSPDCARAVKFQGFNTILLAGQQLSIPTSSDNNIALARFETTAIPFEPPWSPSLPFSNEPSGD